MTRPRWFVAGCNLCVWQSAAVPTVYDAEQLAGTHDDQTHDGCVTAWVEPVASQTRDRSAR
jgi:hypothetical protein